MIEIYGIPEEVGRCYGCRRVKGLLNDLEVPFTWYPVMYKQDGIQYDRPLIVSLAERLNQTSLNIAYPVIFWDGARVKNFDELKKLLTEQGADPVIIQDYS